MIDVLKWLLNKSIQSFIGETDKIQLNLVGEIEGETGTNADRVHKLNPTWDYWASSNGIARWFDNRAWFDITGGAPFRVINKIEPGEYKGAELEILGIKIGNEVLFGDLSYDDDRYKIGSNRHDGRRPGAIDFRPDITTVKKITYPPSESIDIDTSTEKMIFNLSLDIEEFLNFQGTDGKLDDGWENAIILKVTKK